MNFFYVFPGIAVNNAAFFPVFVQIIKQRLHFVLWLFHCKIKVFSVISCDCHKGILHPQYTEDIFLYRFCGSRRIGGKYGTPGKYPEKFRNFQIAGAEILPPLGDAVRFVYCNHGNFRLPGKRKKRLCHQSFRRCINDFISPLRGKFHCLSVLALCERTVYKSRMHPCGIQCCHLVLHQRNQRGYHNGNPGKKQGRYLKTDRFSRPCRHNSQNVASG